MSSRRLFEPVEGAIGEGVGVAIEDTGDVSEDDLVELGAEVEYTVVQGDEARIFYPIAANRLAYEQLRVKAHFYALGAEGERAFEPGDEATVFSNVVRGDADSFRRFVADNSGRVDYDGSVGGRARVTAGSTIGVDDPGVGWRRWDEVLVRH